MVESGKKLMFFVGEYNHTIDAKGRVMVPAKLRDGLGESFYVTKGMDGCLFAYTTEEFEKFQTNLMSLPLTKKELRDVQRIFLAGADSPEPDKQGRILIPQVLREHAGLLKEVVFLGVGNRVEIWDKEKWENNDPGDIDEIAEKLESLGFSI